MKTKHLIIAISLPCIHALAGCSNNKPEDKKPVAATKNSTKPQAPIEFIDLLFADQPISEIQLITASNPAIKDSTWIKLNLASNLVASGKKEDAKKIFQAVTNKKNIDSRKLLWAWNALRELSEAPEQIQVLGLIVEVPQQGTVEYLAIYADRSARYINYTGKIAVWEKHEEKMDRLIKSTLQESQSFMGKYKIPVGRNKKASESIRFSFLTNNGIYQAEENPASQSDQQNDILSLFEKGSQILKEIVTAPLEK
jgi:hypothetical protein